MNFLTGANACKLLFTRTGSVKSSVKAFHYLAQRNGFQFSRTAAKQSRCGCRLMSDDKNPQTADSEVKAEKVHSSSLPKRGSADSSDGGMAPLTWKKVGILLAIGGFATAYVVALKKKKEKERTTIKSIGKPLLGGEWELVDHTGTTKTNKDFFGKWTLIYFGFSNCPDICPEEMEKMVEACDKIKAKKTLKKMPPVVPLFITIDPSRDSVKVVGEYVKEFSPDIVGLTGTNDQVRKAARGYRVYISEGAKDEDNDYIVDHTIIMYLTNPEGDFAEYFGQNKTADQMANEIEAHMFKYKMECL